MTDIRLEVWDRLGSAGFGKRLDLETLTDSARLQPVNAIGEGRASLPDTFIRPEEILISDPFNPINDLKSLVRAYLDGDRSGVDPPFAEWVPNQLIPPAESDSGRWEVSGLGREGMVVDAIALPYDWDGEQVFHSFWPDRIYGGKDIIGPVQSKFTPHIFRAWIDTGATGTATIDIDIDGAGFQSATVAPGDSAVTVEAAIEALPYGIEADVVGDGTAQTPWQINLFGPVGVYTIAINSAGLTGGRLYQELIQYGRPQPIGWTISQIGQTTLPHGQVLEWGSSDGVTDPNFPVAVPAGCDYWIWFRGQEYAFPGIQKRQRVIENGYYTAPPIYLHAIGASALVRIVIRDNNENLIAAEEILIPADTTIQTTGAWVGPGVISGTQLKIPPAVHEIVYRIGHIGPGTPPPIGFACPSLTEGFPQDTIGVVLLELHDDWTTEHAASTFPISFWAHGNGGFFLVPDFTASLDSAGNAWQRDEKITIKRGERFDKILSKIMKLGYEWRIVPAFVDGYYLLQVFNAPDMGTDFSAADTPTIRVGRDVTRLARRVWTARTGALVEGAEQNFAFGSSGAAAAGWGVSLTYAVELDFDEDSLAASALVHTEEALRKTKSGVVNIIDTGEATTPIPGRAYVPGDTVRLIDEDSDEAERVWSILYARTEEGLAFEVQLGNNSFSNS